MSGSTTFVSLAEYRKNWPPFFFTVLTLDSFFYYYSVLQKKVKEQQHTVRIKIPYRGVTKLVSVL